MKKFLILMMALGLLAGSVATAEAKRAGKPARAERTVEASYTTQVVPFDDPYCWRPGGKCVRIEPRKGESFFTASAVDTHGQPVLVTAWGPETGQGTQRLYYGSFCGETDEPIAFIPGFDVDLRVDLPGGNLSPSVVADCPMFGTSGTISVTLSNQAPPAPVRSGSIVTGTGWLLDSQLGGCQISPGCAAWLYSNCEQALAERDPGLTASIVNVDELADGPPIERVFKFGAGWPWGPVWGGVHLQFWTSGCKEIPEARWRSTDCNGDGTGRDCSSLRFLIPPTAKWMTVTGYQDNVNLAWTLT